MHFLVSRTRKPPPTTIGITKCHCIKYSKESHLNTGQLPICTFLIISRPFISTRAALFLVQLRFPPVVLVQKPARVHQIVHRVRLNDDLLLLCVGSVRCSSNAVQKTIRLFQYSRFCLCHWVHQHRIYHKCHTHNIQRKQIAPALKISICQTAAK